MTTAKKIPLEVSNRHVHLSRDDIDLLFGKGYQLKIARRLSQPGQFAAEEKVNLVNGSRKIENVRIVGPERSATQVEISGTEAKKLEMAAPVRISGDIEGSPGITIQGPEGSIVLEKGVIRAKRHIHLSPEDSKMLGLSDGQVTSIRLLEEEGIILEDVFVRVGKNHKLAVHIDSDEWQMLKKRKISGKLLKQAEISPEENRRNIENQASPETYSQHHEVRIN